MSCKQHLLRLILAGPCPEIHILTGPRPGVLTVVGTHASGEAYAVLSCLQHLSFEALPAYAREDPETPKPGKAPGVSPVYSAGSQLINVIYGMFLQYLDRGFVPSPRYVGRGLYGKRKGETTRAEGLRLCDPEEPGEKSNAACFEEVFSFVVRQVAFYSSL